MNGMRCCGDANAQFVFQFGQKLVVHVCALDEGNTPGECIYFFCDLIQLAVNGINFPGDRERDHKKYQQRQHELRIADDIENISIPRC